ncbi:hypothetical protein CS0771_43330 [Catellatospora sp. IY07-71]|uniref:hypothetical protein n=1 Tax=Catellatospora sp. IY07-71 TaxID=2728827 RepID=UPI001BB2F39E|nr:hypothetical protein [Catellatospora sp. IY07-71]BCJ74789.1 hypothetical protein CS0771_43330 [Catellatospora sp. IY07-71]
MAASEVVLGGVLAGAYVVLLVLRRRADRLRADAGRRLRTGRELARGVRRQVRVLRTGLRRRAVVPLRRRTTRRTWRRLPVRPANRNALA